MTGVPAEYIEFFNEAGQLFNMPPWHLAAVARQESNFTVDCDYGGSYGMMQIMQNDWDYYIKMGLGDVLHNARYSFSSSSEAWQIYLKDARMQIISGSYELRHYGNYYLWKKKIVDKLDYKSNENMNLINWQADENDPTLRETLRRIYAIYNGGPGYGMSVDLDHAQNNYPNSVYKYAMEFRSNSICSDGDNDFESSGNEIADKIIEYALRQLGVPYVWGGETPRGFDCSGLMKWAFKQATGVDIVRTAHEQMQASDLYHMKI